MEEEFNLGDFIAGNVVEICKNIVNAILADYGFQNNAIISTIWHVLGGAAEGSTRRQYPKDIKTWPKNITAVKDEYVEKLGNSLQIYVFMYCIHSVFFLYFVDEINHRQSGALKCQFSSSCGKPISFSYYAWLAQLTPEESKEYKTKYDLYTLVKPNSDLQKCPNDECGAYVEKNNSFPMRYVKKKKKIV
ncbi:hypothetical protein RFI_23056 [Reticulomyxa filosa]|uniref:Uncharacterized protein n=1 Tax=Reticulomyxa filosa TaxID=46433 RepID=X6MLI6_RETFI|nr:hypothetical protein RFI_23056 [Reticulomyxa filosa]|eukprot:ETO14312.1 hypothetical protein RFI_23056 [Reticulomyxa filosa]